jgi:hypothetical protein
MVVCQSLARPVMDEPQPTDSPPPSGRISTPPHLHYDAGHRLIAWHPHDVLNDELLDEILAWLREVEKGSPPFNRFIDFTHVTKMALQIGHLFTVAQERAEKYRAIAPIKTAFYCDTLAGFGTAHLYEMLMKNTSIEARTFQDLAEAAGWLNVPEEILRLDPEANPHG